MLPVKEQKLITKQPVISYNIVEQNRKNKLLLKKLIHNMENEETTVEETPEETVEETEETTEASE